MGIFEILAILGTVGVVGLAGFVAGMYKSSKNRKAETEKRLDTVIGCISKLTEKQTELERRQHCLEEDFEKIPIEEIEDEKLRLERFNDGIMNIMNFGPDVPKLNKEVLKHE